MVTPAVTGPEVNRDSQLCKYLRVKIENPNLFTLHQPLQDSPANIKTQQQTQPAKEGKIIQNIKVTA